MLSEVRWVQAQMLFSVVVVVGLSVYVMFTYKSTDVMQKEAIAAGVGEYYVRDGRMEFRFKKCQDEPADPRGEREPEWIGGATSAAD